MSDSDGKIEFGAWKNDKRTKRTQPHLKASKPVEIGGQRYWLSVWVKDGKRDDLEDSICRMLDVLQEANGKVPILSISLEPADEHHQAAPAHDNVDPGDRPW